MFHWPRLDVPLKERVFRYKGVTAREGRPCPASDSVDCQMSTKQKYASGALDIFVFLLFFLLHSAHRRSSS